MDHEGHAVSYAHNSVRFGDVITLYNESLQGWLTSGDQVIGWGLWLPKLREKMTVPPRVRDARFEIVPKLGYSKLKAFRKKKQELSLQGKDTSKELEELKLLIETERQQNTTECARLQGEDVLYGQVVQLFCSSAGEYVTVRKTMAKIESQCLKVEMDDVGDEGSWFRVEPAFKFRALGNRVAHGDSIRLISVKFEQFLHVSPRSVPFTTLYIDGVYEVNASQSVTQFQVIPFATGGESQSREIFCGQVTCIFHSEINAVLMYDPVHSSRGPYWLLNGLEGGTNRQVSNSLWIIESESVEWGGGVVSATCGVKPNDRSKRRGYRLEHANSGQYLALSSAMSDGVTRLSVTDAFMGDKALWFFHYKNEGNDEEEGKLVHMAHDSVSPVYMQHATGVWLSQASAEPKTSRGVAAPSRERLVGCRKELSFTDSLSLLNVDQKCMTEISRLLKFLKPLEFFLADLRRREQSLDMGNIESPALLRAIRELLPSKQSKAGGDGPDAGGSKQGDFSPLKESLQSSIAQLNPVNLAQSVKMSNLNPFAQQAEVAEELPFSQVMINTVEAMRKKAAADKNRVAQRKLAKLFWDIVKTRIRTLVNRKHTEENLLLTKKAELNNSLVRILEWLGNDSGMADQRKWLQNTLREQGALEMLSQLLKAMVNTGLAVREFVPKGKVKSLHDVVVSKSFFEIGQAIYDILRLSCQSNTKNSLALETSISLYELHLGTRCNAAALLREIFKNEKIMHSLGPNDVRRYALLLSQHRRPAFVQLIRSLLTCDGKPVALNQVRISRYLLAEFSKCLPEVKVVLNMAGDTEARIFVKITHDSADVQLTPSRSVSRMASNEWCDLSLVQARFSELISKDGSVMDDREVSVAFYGDVLKLLRDLCAGRCDEAMTMLSDNQQLGLEFDNLLAAMKSNLVPLEVRARLCEIMIHLHLDREPQQAKPVVQIVHAWSKADDRTVARGPGTGRAPNFEALKAATLDHLENCVKLTADSATLQAHVRLLKRFCEIAVKLCNFGFFTPATDSDAGTADVRRLIHAALDNLSEGSLLRDGIKSDPAFASTVLVLLCSVLEFAFDVRTDLRTKRLIEGYKRGFEERGQSQDRFWDEAVIEGLHEKVTCQILSPRLDSAHHSALIDCLLSLTKIQGNVKLQASAFKLLMRQAAPVIEVMDVAKRVELLENQDAVSCWEKLCRSIASIRANLHDVSKERPEAIDTVCQELLVLMELLDQDRYDKHLVQESQKFMRLNSCHLFVCDILQLKLEVTCSPNKLDQAVNESMLKLFNECYKFLQCFCFRNHENQVEVFGKIGLFFEHISVAGLNSAECVIASIRDNPELCAKVTEKILRRFMTAIVKYGKYARWLRFMLVCLAIDGLPLKRNQDLVLRILEEEAEILLEIDGNQGGGEGEAAQVLVREGTATRLELMMAREHTKPDSFLEYHVTCLELLAKCAEGKNQASKDKCQALLSFNGVMESILDLHLTPPMNARPEFASKKVVAVPPDALHFVRSGFVKFLHHVYVTRTDPKTQKLFTDDSNRWYACSSLMIEKWRNPIGLMDHFIEEIDSLRKAFVTNKGAALSVKDFSKKESPLSSYSVEAITPLQYHWSYVFGAVLPCLCDYYSYQYWHSLSQNVNARFAEACKQFAGHLAHALTSLLDTIEVQGREAEVCASLFSQLDRIDINLKSTKAAAIAVQLSARTSHPVPQVWLKSSWKSFVYDVARRAGVGEGRHDTQNGTREVARLLSERERGDEFIAYLMEVLKMAMQNPELVDQKFSVDLLKILRGTIHISVSTPKNEEANWALFLQDRPPIVSQPSIQIVQQRFLKSSVLQTAMLMLSHSKDEVVHAAVRLAWLILMMCRKDAQIKASEVLEGENGRAVLDSCRRGMKLFLDKMKAGKKQRRKSDVSIESRLDMAGILPHNKKVFSANHACELLQMIELLCKGNRKVQENLRQHSVLNALVDVLEEIERNILSSVTNKDMINCFTLAKGFHVLIAAVEGPNYRNRIALTHTNILLMMNRVLATLSYNGPESVHNVLKASIRCALIQLLLELLQSPSDAIVAKRVLETIDWALFFKCWKEVKDLFQCQMKGWGKDSSEFLMSLQERSIESMHEFLDRMDRHGQHSDVGFVISDDSATHPNPGADEEPRAQYNSPSRMIEHATIDLTHEGFMMANIIKIATEDSLFSTAMSSLTRRQEDLRRWLADDDFSLFYGRLASVEILREGVLERLYFRIPETCFRLKDDEHFLDEIKHNLFEDLETENDDERQLALLKRMTACSDHLQCEFELSTGPHRWMIEYKSGLESFPLWTSVGLNAVFVLGFEEHGPGAEVCTCSWFIDMGLWGKPFFHLSPWVMLLLAVAHFISSAARFGSDCIQRLEHAKVQARRQLLLAAQAAEVAGAGGSSSGSSGGGEREVPPPPPAPIDQASLELHALKALLVDRRLWLTGTLLLSSLLGFFASPFFYAIPLVDLLRSPTVLLLLETVQHNANKLGQGALVGALLVYGHAIVGYGFFHEFHQEGKCENLFGCSVTYLISGIKGSSIEDSLEDLATPAALWSNMSMWARIALDMSFHIIIPLILLSIISGIIIDGFGELRDQETEAKHYRENTSVICGIDRMRMEQANPGSFDKHLAEDQNPYHYIYLLRKLQLQPAEVDTVQESHVRQHVLQESPGFLPRAAICMQAKHDDTAGNELKREVRDQGRRSPRLAIAEEPTNGVEEVEKKEFWQGLNPLDMKLGMLNPLDMKMPAFMPDVRMPDLRLPVVDDMGFSRLTDLKLSMPTMRLPDMRFYPHPPDSDGRPDAGPDGPASTGKQPRPDDCKHQ